MIGFQYNNHEADMCLHNQTLFPEGAFEEMIATSAWSATVNSTDILTAVRMNSTIPYDKRTKNMTVSSFISAAGLCLTGGYRVISIIIQ
jgi:hypothetical protein